VAYFWWHSCGTSYARGINSWRALQGGLNRHRRPYQKEKIKAKKTGGMEYLPNKLKATLLPHTQNL
jgi:hypothetical protein